MRKELVAAALEDIREQLFSDVVYTVLGGQPVTILNAIYGVEVATEDQDYFGHPVRNGTHVAYGPIALFPGLAKGDLIEESAVSYRVVDCKPWGDGRLEWAISLVKA